MRREPRPPAAGTREETWPRGAPAWEIRRAERLDPTTVLLTLAGEVDAAAYGPAAEVLRRLEGQGARVVVIDLEPVAFLGGAGVRLLLEAQARADAGGWALVVVAPRPPADRILDIAGPAVALNLTRRPVGPRPRRA